MMGSYFFIVLILFLWLICFSDIFFVSLALGCNSKEKTSYRIPLLFAISNLIVAPTIRYFFDWNAFGLLAGVPYVVINLALFTITFFFFQSIKSNLIKRFYLLCVAIFCISSRFCLPDFFDFRKDPQFYTFLLASAFTTFIVSYIGFFLGSAISQKYHLPEKKFIIFSILLLAFLTPFIFLVVIK